jgi:hypothetical protein
MDKSFGFNLNASMVIDKDGKTSCGVSYKDSEGYNFRKDKKGEDVNSVLTDLANDFVDGYTEHFFSTKAAEKAKEVADSASEKPKPQVSDALTKRLRELEEENRRLKAEKAAAEYKNGTRATTCATTSVPVKVSEKPKSESKPAKPIKKDENKELDAAFSDFYAALDDFKKATREFSIFDLL